MSRVTDRFLALELQSRLLVATKRAAVPSVNDIWQSASRTLAPVGNALRSGADAAGGAVFDFLEAGTPESAAAAVKSGRDLANLPAGRLADSSMSLAPPAPALMNWSDRLTKLWNNPQAMQRAALIGGGVAAGTLATHVVNKIRQSRRRRIAMEELERLGLGMKMSGFDWKSWGQQGLDAGGQAVGQAMQQGTEAVSNWTSQPQNQEAMKLFGGSAAAGAVLTALYQRRQAAKQLEARRQARMEQLLGVKQAAGEAKWWQPWYDRAAKAYTDYKVGNAVNGVGSKLEEYKGMLRAALVDPAKRPYVAAAIGAAAGGATGGLAELMSGRRRKRYLNSILTGATGGALLGGAYGGLTSGSGVPKIDPAGGGGKGFDVKSGLGEQSTSDFIASKAEEIQKLPLDQREQAIAELNRLASDLKPNPAVELAADHPNITTGAAAGAGALAGEAAGYVKDMHSRDITNLAKNRAATALEELADANAKKEYIMRAETLKELEHAARPPKVMLADPPKAAPFDELQPGWQEIKDRNEAELAAYNKKPPLTPEYAKYLDDIEQHKKNQAVRSQAYTDYAQVTNNAKAARTAATEFAAKKLRDTTNSSFIGRRAWRSGGGALGGAALASHLLGPILAGRAAAAKSQASGTWPSDAPVVNDVPDGPIALDGYPVSY